MKLAFIALRGKERIEVILDDYLLWKAKYSPSLVQFKKDFSIKGKFYPRMVEATERYQGLKKFYSKQGYKIRIILSDIEHKRLFQKCRAELKAQKPKVFTDKIMGLKVRLAENEHNSGEKYDSNKNRMGKKS